MKMSKKFYEKPFWQDPVQETSNVLGLNSYNCNFKKKPPFYSKSGFCILSQLLLVFEIYASAFFAISKASFKPSGFLPPAVA